MSILRTPKEIRDELRGGANVYRKGVSCGIRVIDAKVQKGVDKVRLMYFNGDTEWVTHSPGDTYTML